jgi:mRNA-degrading endonuclease HigB of HigAB toxin-antitoxin module
MKISPPAFPTYLAENMAHGMGLRDYFAAVALPLIIKEYSQSNAIFNITEVELRVVSKMAYEFSDAMMKAREE